MKQEGYDYGLAARSNFIAEVIQGNKKQVDFVDEHIESIIHSDRVETKKSVDRLQSEIDTNTRILDAAEKDKNAELKLLNDEFLKKNSELELQKDEIINSFSDISDNVIQNLSEAKKMLEGFICKLEEYISDGETYCINQANKIKDERTKYMTNGKSIVRNEIRDLLVEGNEKEIKENKYSGYGKDICGLIVFICLCIYDIFFGHEAIQMILPSIGSGWQRFLAGLFVPAVIFLVHYSSMVFSSRASAMKGLGTASIIVVLIIVIFYVAQSLPDSVKEMIPERLNFFYYLLTDPNGLTAIFRLLIIPSLFVGEIIIEKSNWNELFGNTISKLVVKGLIALKDKSIVKWGKNEKIQISELIEKIKSEMKPDYKMLEEDLLQIKSYIDPIYDKQEGKKGIYEQNLGFIQGKIDELKKIYDEKKLKIEKIFIEKTKENSEIISKNTTIIDKYNKELSHKEQEIRAGFVCGIAE